jgi:REP element-mobilizing transposase RayT
MVRGNDGQTVFADEGDRRRLCNLLADGVDRFDHRIHAYCFMGNHIHLAIEVGEVSLSRVVQNFAFRYTRSFNWRAKRTGHLFQGRFRSIEVDRDSHLLELVRYIHCNPVRAGLVRSPDAWVWSGHRTYLGTEATPWLTTDLVLGMLAEGDHRLARRRYAGFVREGLGETDREEFHRWSSPATKGSQSIQAAPRGRADRAPAGLHASLDTIIAEVCLSLGLVEVDLVAPGKVRRLSETRALVGWIVQETGVATLTEVGQRFGRDVATLSRQVAQLRCDLRRDADAARQARELCLRLRGANNAITQA